MAQFPHEKCLCTVLIHLPANQFREWIKSFSKMGWIQLPTVISFVDLGSRPFGKNSNTWTQNPWANSASWLCFRNVPGNKSDDSRVVTQLAAMGTWTGIYKTAHVMKLQVPRSERQEADRNEQRAEHFRHVDVRYKMQGLIESIVL